MKNNIIISILLLIPFIFISCSSSDPEEKITGTFSSETALGGTYKIKPTDSYINGTFSVTKQ